MWLAENWGDLGNSLHPCPYSTTAGAAARDERAGLVDAPSGTHARLSTWSNCKTWRDDESNLATQAFLFDQTCWRPMDRQIYVVRPVGIDRFVKSHPRCPERCQARSLDRSC